jgi:indolepyruvate ferredoxin oxidoreductase
MRMPGVGGTGVVTISAILQTAAHLDGRRAAGLEQIGLAQKGGPVLSDIRIADAPIDGALRAGSRSADVLIGFDLLGAAARETLAVCDPLRTVAVLNATETPTAAMVTDARQQRTPASAALARVAAVTRPGEDVVVDAGTIAQRLFRDHMPANMVLVGAAFQHGCIPLSAAAIERAIELNGTAAETNRAAFAWGRVAVADPEAVAAALDELDPPPQVETDERALRIVDALDPPDADLRRALEIRASELIGFQGAALAERYAAEVMRVDVIARERAGRIGGSVSHAYAQGLFKLTAYKDEYEVARLHLDAAERARLRSELGADAKLEILLHPPLLRALGLRGKLRLRGGWAFPMLRVLSGGRRLRGTAFDPFGHTRVRRAERALIGEYRELVNDALEHLTPRNARQVAEIGALPDVVRGYEQIKLRGIEDFRTRAATLMQSLTRLPPPAPELTVRRVPPAHSGAAPLAVGETGRPRDLSR